VRTYRRSSASLKQPSSIHPAGRKAVCALGAYVGLGDESIDVAMKKVLANPKHKIAHAAAGYLGIACPSRGKTFISPPNRPK
jgi:hypothetical protein